MNACLFCKFISQQIPKEFVYQDDFVVVFPDIHPVKPVHLLIVPKVHIPDFAELTDDTLLGHVRAAIQAMVKEYKLTSAGYRIVVNAGGAQAINHLHFHLLGPMGSAADL